MYGIKNFEKTNEKLDELKKIIEELLNNTDEKYIFQMKCSISSTVDRLIFPKDYLLKLDI